MEYDVYLESDWHNLQLIIQFIQDQINIYDLDNLHLYIYFN